MVKTRSQALITTIKTIKNITTPRMIKTIKTVRTVRTSYKYGQPSYRKNIDHDQKIHKDLSSMPPYMQCPCGGGQSCLIDRRWLGEWCHEDNLFKLANVPLRRSCMDPYTVEQEIALTREIQDNTVFWDNSHTWKD